MQRLAGDGVLRIVLMRVARKSRGVPLLLRAGGRDGRAPSRLRPELARYSPGLVATLETIRLASDDGMRRVEFLGGGERYKLELADHLEPLSEGRRPWRESRAGIAAGSSSG